MLCFTLAAVLIAPTISSRAMVAMSKVTDYDVVMDTDRALIVGGMLIATGLALKALATFSRRDA